MSECNYCSFERIKRQAKHDGKQVVTQKGWKKGTDVFVVPKDTKVAIKPSQSFRDKFFVSWFWVLTDHCVC